MTLGKRIKESRKKQGLTLVDLAGNHITKGMLSLIENDKSKPSMETLDYISEKLGVSIGYLTQSGDEEWTKKILENEVFMDMFNFPGDFIEKNILPDFEKIADSQKGMEVYQILRIYYRYRRMPAEAEAMSKKIGGFYNEKGLNHLALADKLNDVSSMLYSKEYYNAYQWLIDLEEEVETLKEYDSKTEEYYLYIRSLFAVNFDIEDFIQCAEKLMDLSFKKERFGYYASINSDLSRYYGLTGDVEKYEYYQERVKKYLEFNPHSNSVTEMYTPEQPVQLYYVLVDEPKKHVNNLEEYIKRVSLINNQRSTVFLREYSYIFDLEIAYHKGYYQKVVDTYEPKRYHRPLAQHPIDRVLMAIRSAVYPMSLFSLGRKEEARAAFNEIEETISDIKDIFFTKEFYMIKDIIFKK